SREGAIELAFAQAEADSNTRTNLQEAWEEDRRALVSDLQATRSERDELRQKFGLAIEDVGHLRGRVAELETELANRPAPDQTASVELVHVRAERDALAERLAELERQPAAPVAGEPSEELAVLQRRFELAVEDVRDLKRKNSELESLLSEAKSQPSAAP